MYGLKVGSLVTANKSTLHVMVEARRGYVEKFMNYVGKVVDISGSYVEIRYEHIPETVRLPTWCLCSVITYPEFRESMSDFVMDINDGNKQTRGRIGVVERKRTVSSGETVLSVDFGGDVGMKTLPAYAVRSIEVTPFYGVHDEPPLVTINCDGIVHEPAVDTEDAGVPDWGSSLHTRAMTLSNVLYKAHSDCVPPKSEIMDELLFIHETLRMLETKND